MISTILKIIAAVVILFTLFILYHFQIDVPVTTEEVFREDEAEQATRSINNFIKVLKKNRTDYVARGAHAKGHACVKAYFEVNEDIQPELQHGIFHKPGKRYKGWIRFSNGASRIKDTHDADKDARGMAIKLFDIYRDGLKRAEGEPNTQEFLMHDSPVFFSGNVEDYNQFVESPDKVGYFVSDPNPFKWKLRELKHGLATLKEAPVSPLWNSYFSNTAYKLGPHNIKFSAQSCSTPDSDESQDKTDPNFLRKALATELKNREGCFDFMVQRQNPEKQMPIEDPSVEWKTSDSPFIKVARINIPMQEFDTPAQRDFCENLSFSPWHSLDAHRPVGELNRIRKKVYAASSKYRHEQNETRIPTNIKW